MRKSQCSISWHSRTDKDCDLEEREAREMAMLISLVNNLAPGTAIDIDIHFSAYLCKSLKET